MNPIWLELILLSNQIGCKSKMVAKWPLMTSKLLQMAIIHVLFTSEL